MADGHTASSQAAGARVGRPWLGIGLFLASLLLAAIHIGMSKALTAELSVPLVVWGRYVGFLLLTLPFAIYRHGDLIVRPPALPLLLLRGVLITAGNWLFIAAVAGAPMADMTAILFVYPFLITALAPLVLGEPNSGRSWIAVSAGFLGVLVVLRPGSAAIDWHGLLALLTGCCFGAQLLVTRLASRTAPAMLTVTVTALVGAVMTSLALPFYWQPLNGEQIVLLAGLGAVVALSQALLIVACGKAEMATLAPFTYAEIVFAAAVGYAAFAEVPDMLAWIGISVIIASGLLVALPRRTRRNR